MSPSTMVRAVFVDRDGVINPLLYHRDAGIVDSPFTLAQFRVTPGAPQAIRRLNDLGLAVVLVSNQPGIAKGHYAPAVLRAIDRKMRRAVASAGGHFDAVYYCLHHPQARMRKLRVRCACRKPGIGMLLQAARDLGISLDHSYMVGDGLTDIEAGSRAGCRTVFVGRWKCEHCQFIRPSGLRPDIVAGSLLEASRIIAAEVSRRAVPPAPLPARPRPLPAQRCPSSL